MGASGTLTRKLDSDLIARIEASGRPEKKKQLARKKTPRLGTTYRGARRNAVRPAFADMPRHAPETIESIAPAARLNRSENWPRAKTYAYAREISPSAEPVR